MPGGDGQSSSVSATLSTVDGAVLKPDAAQQQQQQQLLSPDRASASGIFAQLTSNPFFTAVSSDEFNLDNTLNHDRDLGSPASGQLRHLLVEVLATE